MIEGAEHVGGRMFREIRADDRVTADLAHCLYCTVSSPRGENGFIDTHYKIPLDNISKWCKQCPACKAVYILKDPTE